MEKTILDYERVVEELKGLAAMSYFFYEGNRSSHGYLEDRAMGYLQERLIEVADKVEELFEIALENYRGGENDNR